MQIWQHCVRCLPPLKRNWNREWGWEDRASCTISSWFLSNKIPHPFHLEPTTRRVVSLEDWRMRWNDSGQCWFVRSCSLAGPDCFHLCLCLRVAGTSAQVCCLETRRWDLRGDGWIGWDRCGRGWIILAIFEERMCRKRMLMLSESSSCGSKSQT